MSWTLSAISDIVTVTDLLLCGLFYAYDIICYKFPLPTRIYIFDPQLAVLHYGKELSASSHLQNQTNSAIE